MANWNRGLELCTGKYFGKLDHDDWWDKDMLAACYRILESDETVGLVFSKHYLVNESDQTISQEYDLPDFANEQTFHGVDLVQKGVHGMLADNVMKQGIGLMRKAVFDELGPFSLHDSGDTEMWFRIAARYKIFGLNKFYHFHRVWPQNFTRSQILKTGKQEKNLFEVRLDILTRYFAEGLIDQKFLSRQLKTNQFEYNKHLVYQNRVQRNFGKMLLALMRNLITNPIDTVKFYWGRLNTK